MEIIKIDKTKLQNLFKEATNEDHVSEYSASVLMQRILNQATITEEEYLEREVIKEFLPKQEEPNGVDNFGNPVKYGMGGGGKPKQSEEPKEECKHCFCNDFCHKCGTGNSTKASLPDFNPQFAKYWSHDELNTLVKGILIYLKERE